MKMMGDIPVWGDPIDTQALEQIQMCRDSSPFVALMADHHVGYSMPIGGVAGYLDAISPSGVGFDIACGNKAVLTDAKLEDVQKNIETIMDDIYSKIEFGIGRTNSERVDHDLFDDPAWSIRTAGSLKEMARAQLGTVGSGNHYVDIFKDEQDRIWIGVHFGSRGFGHKIASFFITAGGGKDGMMEKPVVLSLQSPLGQDYLECMKLAGRYAYAGRDYVCNQVAKILGAKILDEVHNHHNFAWLETHHGVDLWVVRKGATPAFPGQRGFVGGSMGDISVILEGVDSEEAKLAMNSTIHGAGRVLSRTQAAGKRRKGKTSGGLITREMMDAWIKPMGVVLRGAGTDESPHCYKRLPEVLGHHKNTVRILQKLNPLGVAMAGPDTYDPYKD